jgi:hypothetical protein
LEFDVPDFARAAHLVKRWRNAEPTDPPSLAEASQWCGMYDGGEISAAFEMVRNAGRLATYRAEFARLLKLRRQARDSA